MKNIRFDVAGHLTVTPQQQLASIDAKIASERQTIENVRFFLWLFFLTHLPSFVLISVVHLLNRTSGADKQS